MNYYGPSSEMILRASIDQQIKWLESFLQLYTEAALILTTVVFGLMVWLCISELKQPGRGRAYSSAKRQQASVKSYGQASDYPPAESSSIP